jgi:hypothetical protein
MASANKRLQPTLNSGEELVLLQKLVRVRRFLKALRIDRLFETKSAFRTPIPFLGMGSDPLWRRACPGIRVKFPTYSGTWMLGGTPHASTLMGVQVRVLRPSLSSARITPTGALPYASASSTKTEYDRHQPALVILFDSPVRYGCQPSPRSGQP